MKIVGGLFLFVVATLAYLAFWNAVDWWPPSWANMLFGVFVAVGIVGVLRE